MNSDELYVASTFDNFLWITYFIHSYSRIWVKNIQEEQELKIEKKNSQNCEREKIREVVICCWEIQLFLSPFFILREIWFGELYTTKFQLHLFHFSFLRIYILGKTFNLKSVKDK